MRIAVLAWGSLIWDRRELAIAGDFMPCGPYLLIEFCRVTRDGRLTLAIDETFGASCATYSGVSAAGDLDAAVENLRRTALRYIRKALQEVQTPVRAAITHHWPGG